MTKFSQTYSVRLKPAMDSYGVSYNPVKTVKAEDFEVDTSGETTYVRFFKDEQDDGNDVSVALFPIDQIESITSE